MNSPERKMNWQPTRQREKKNNAYGLTHILCMQHSAGISEPLVLGIDLRYPGKTKSICHAVDAKSDGGRYSLQESDVLRRYLDSASSLDDKSVVLNARRPLVEHAEILTLFDVLSDTGVPEVSHFKNPGVEEPLDDIAIKDRPVKLKRFKPTVALAQFVTRGFEAFEELASEHERPQELENLRSAVPQDSLTPEEVREAITVRLERMFSTLGFRARASGLDSAPVTSENRFDLSIQYEILDRLYTRPDETGDFLRLLLKDLKAFVRQGGHLGGNWGKLTVDSNELIMSILPSKTVDTENWELPTKVDVI